MSKREFPLAGVLEVKKQLASAVAANRSEDIKRLLLRLRQELVVSEELLRVGICSGLLSSYRLDVAHAYGVLAGDQDWPYGWQTAVESQQADRRSSQGYRPKGMYICSFGPF